MTSRLLVNRSNGLHESHRGRSFADGRKPSLSLLKTKPFSAKENFSSASQTTAAGSSSSLLKMRSSSLLVLALLHHGMTSASAFGVAPTTSPGGFGLSSPPGKSSSGSCFVPVQQVHHHPTIPVVISSSRRYAASSRHNRRSVTTTEEDCTSTNPGTADSGMTNNKKHHKQQRGWRRRVMSRLQRRKRGSLESTATADETPCTRTKNPGTAVDEFILENFEKLSPEQLFSTLEKTQYTLDRGTTTTTADHQSPFFEAPVELPVVVVEETTTTNTTTTTTNASTTTEVATFDDDEEEELLLDCAAPISLIGATSSFEGGPPVRKVVRNWFQNLLTNCFCEWAAEEPVNLCVRCSPTGNVLGQLLRGEIQCNARAEFDRLVFEFLRLSGGTIEGSRLALNLLAFTVDHSKESHSNKDDKHNTRNPVDKSKQQQPTTTTKPTTQRKTRRLLETKKMLPRYQTQFDLHAHDCILTQEDLFESSCVRNGLQNLLKRVLKTKGIRTNSVLLTDISILDTTNKLSVKGEANVHGARVAFEVRSGIGFKHRGHVVTFPGLELSLSSSPDGILMGFFVPISGVELDIGHNARIRECTLDGNKKQLKIAASVTITPQHTLKLSEEYIQSSHAYSAPFSYDVGKWLTRVGRFSL